MERVVEDASSSELLAALEGNLVGFWSAYGRAPAGALHATAEVVWFYTGIQVPLFNGVLYANMERERMEATVVGLQTMIDERGAAALWWIGPYSKPENLGELLIGYGLQPAGEVPGMAVDLASVEIAKEIAGFQIEKVGNAQMQWLWAQVAGAGSEFTHVAIETMARLEAALTGPEYQTQQCYIGFLNGVPVATSALALAAGVAGIYAVATLPEARGKGIGTAMTAQPLLEARQAGYRVGILQASSMGYPVYRKMGFRDVCEYELYLQSPHEA